MRSIGVFLHRKKRIKIAYFYETDIVPDGACGYIEVGGMSRPDFQLQSSNSASSDRAFDLESPAVMSHVDSNEDGTTAPRLQKQFLNEGHNSASCSSEYHEYEAATKKPPRPEIVLRWKRFLVIVLAACGVVCGITGALQNGIMRTDLKAEDAETETDTYNIYSGVVVGVLESIVMELMRFFFPVFVVYLHNLPWFPGDNPATKVYKFKKVILLLFMPIVMVAVGNSMSAVQFNQVAGDTSRRLQLEEPYVSTSHESSSHIWKAMLPASLELDDSLATCTKDMEGVDGLLRAGVESLRVGVKTSFSVHEWSHEVLSTPLEAINFVESSVAQTLMSEGQRLVAQMLRTEANSSLVGLDMIVDSVNTALKTDVSKTDIKVETEVKQGLGLVYESVLLDVPVEDIGPLNLNSMSNSCGTTGCLVGEQSQLKLPITQVVASGCGNGFLVVGISDYATYESLSKAQVSGVTRIIQLSIGKLTWSVKKLLSLTLKNGRHAVVTSHYLPSVIHDTKLLQLLEPRSLGGRAALPLKLTGSSLSACSAAVAKYLKYTEKNHLQIGKEIGSVALEVSLLLVFQHAVLVGSDDVSYDAALKAVERRLQMTPDKVEVLLKNTSVGTIFAWIASGILLLLTILMLVVPNERARLFPPQGGNARAERFIQVQTEQVYPNLIYKKRFRIGRTGEKLKFNKFAVESVSLHHRLEEDEQIVL